MKDEIKHAKSLIHVSFDGWTTPNRRWAITGIYVHHLSRNDKIMDNMIAMSAQSGRHFGINYSDTIGDVLNTLGHHGRQSRLLCGG
jgi:hypothetical protein